MMEFTVRLNSVKEVSMFINAANLLQCDIELSHGRYVVNGKSMMGILALDLTKILNVCIYSDDISDELIKNFDIFRVTT